MTLAVSELVTNAVIHGRGLVEVSLTAKRPDDPHRGG
jgi:anti-sigma regulatory factor (Ser/Thr protein kinase)